MELGNLKVKLIANTKPAERSIARLERRAKNFGRISIGFDRQSLRRMRRDLNNLSRDMQQMREVNPLEGLGENARREVRAYRDAVESMPRVTRTATQDASSIGRGGGKDIALGIIGGFSAVGIASSLTGILSGAINTAISAARGSLQRAMRSEQFGVQIGALASSFEAGKQLQKDIRKLAQDNPLLDISGAQQGARALLGAGIPEGNITKRLEQMGTAAAATGASIAEIGDAFGEVRAEGKLMDEQLDELASRGINLREELSAVTDIPLSKLKQAISDGKVSFQDFSRAWSRWVQGLGNVKERMQNTLGGQIDQARIAVTSLQREVGGALLPAFKGVAQVVADSLNNALRNSDQWLAPLKQSAKNLGNELAESDQLRQALTRGFQTLAQEGVSLVTDGVRSIARYLKNNPTAIKEAITETREWASILKDVLKNIGSILQGIKETASAVRDFREGGGATGLGAARRKAKSGGFGDRFEAIYQQRLNEVKNAPFWDEDFALTINRDKLAQEAYEKAKAESGIETPTSRLRTPSAPPSPSSPSSSPPPPSTPDNQPSGSNTNARVKAFLDTIAYAEGTFNRPNQGYNTLYGGGQFQGYGSHPRRAITAGGYTSTAAGRYQILDKTYDSLGMSGFSPESQDQAALQLIKQQGALDDVRKGNFEAAIRKLNNIWASFPGSPYGQPTKNMGDLASFYRQQLGGAGSQPSNPSPKEDEGEPLNLGTAQQAANLLQKQRRQQERIRAAKASRNRNSATRQQLAGISARFQPQIQATQLASITADSESAKTQWQFTRRRLEEEQQFLKRKVEIKSEIQRLEAEIANTDDQAEQIKLQDRLEAEQQSLTKAKDDYKRSLQIINAKEEERLETIRQQNKEEREQARLQRIRADQQRRQQARQQRRSLQRLQLQSLPRNDIGQRSQYYSARRRIEGNQLANDLARGDINPEEYNLKMGQLRRETNVFRQELGFLRGSFQKFFTSISTGAESIGSAFKNMISGILGQFQKLAAEAAANKLFNLILGGGRSRTGGGGLLSGLFGGLGGLAVGGGITPTGAASSALKIGTGGLFSFPGIPGFAEGGVVSKPTLGTIGEKQPEAVVPLKNGSIPVKGGGDSIQVNLNIDKPVVRSDKDLERLSQQIDGKIRAALVDQKRPNGVLR